MKVLFVINDLDPGGITTALLNIIRECYNHGLEVDLLCLSQNVFIPKEFEHYCNQINISNNNLKFLYLTKNDVVKCKNIYYKIYLYSIGIFKALMTRLGMWTKFIVFVSPKLGPYDIAIAYRKGPVCAQLITELNAKKRVGFMHGDVKDMIGIEKWIKNYYRINKIACVSKAVENSFVEKFPYFKDRSCTIYNMFDPEEIFVKSKSEELIIKNEDKKIVFVTLSRLSVEKGTERIPEIADNLVKKTAYGSFEWFILGDGPQYETLISETKKRGLESILHFEGVQNNPFKYLKNCDASVLISYTEGYPMSVIESLILKKPVIATGYSAVEEMIKDEINGIIIKENTVDGITKALSKFILDQKYRSKIQNGASNYKYDKETPWQQFRNEVLVNY